MRRAPAGMTGNAIPERESPGADTAAPVPAAPAAGHSDEGSAAWTTSSRPVSGPAIPRPSTPAWTSWAGAVVREALRQCGGNRSQAARLLGAFRPTLLARMEKYGLKVETRISDE